MRTKIAYIVEAFGGGVLSVIKDSIEILQEHFSDEFEFTIIYSIRPDTPENIDQQFTNVKFVHLQMGSSAFEKTDILSIIQLRRLLQAFDVIHMHSSRAGFLGRIALSTLFNKPKSFYSPHCFGFLNLEFSNAKRKLVWFIEYLLSKTSSSTFIACGPSEYEIAKRISKNSELVTNGYSQPANFDNFNKKECSSLQVVGSGRNVLQKDPHFFIQITHKNKNTDIEFAWIGSIDSQIATGWLTREEAYRKLNECDVFLATSLWEGLPVNGIEALSLGKPLIVRNTSSYIDLVTHGKNGFIFETIDEALQYLDELSKDKEMLKGMSIKAKETAAELFSKENYLQLYKLYKGKK